MIFCEPLNAVSRNKCSNISSSGSYFPFLSASYFSFRSIDERPPAPVPTLPTIPSPIQHHPPPPPPNVSMATVSMTKH